MSAFDDYFSSQGSSATAVKTATAPTATSGSAFDNYFKTSTKTSTPPPTTPTKNVVPSGGTKITIPSGNEAYKTPSGSIWEYLPDGTRQITLGSQFGGGAYNINPKNTNQVINSGHTTYGNQPAVPGQQRDDIIPVGLGGVNQNPANIKNTPLASAKNTDKLETQLAADVKAGKISLGAAQLKILTAKNQVQPSFWQKVASVIGDIGTGISTVANQVPGAIGDTFSGVTSVIKGEFKPSNTEKSLEQGGGLGVLTPIVRAVEPLLEGYGQDISSIIFSNKQSKQLANEKPTVIGKQVQPSSIQQNTSPITKEDVLNVILHSASVGALIAPIISGWTAEGVNNFADYISKNTKVPISYSDLQKITTSTSDVEAISKVGQEKFNAVKDATANNANLQGAIKQGYIELAQKEPSTFANILRNAATRPVSEIGSFNKAYGQPIKTTTPPLLNETNPATQPFAHETTTSVVESKPFAHEIAPVEATTSKNAPFAHELPVKPVVAPKTAPTEAITPKVDYTPASQKVVSAFDKSTGQQVIATKDNTNFELGSFGKNAEINKAENPDRFSQNKLPETIANIKNVYKASDDSTNYRSGNKAWVAEMPNGEKRVIYTRTNTNGAEEIINWHSVNETKNPNYIKQLESYGSPTGSRTQIAPLEGEKSIPLAYGTKESISQAEKNVNPFSQEANEKPVVKAEIKPETPKTPLEEGKITKVASDINTALVKKGVKALTPEQQSKFTEGTYKGSVEKVASMMDKSIEQVKEMAITGENIPTDIHPQILFNSIEALATKNNDIQLLRDLANSPLGTQLSEAGGTLGSHGFNDNPNSAVARIKEVVKAKRAGVTKKVGDISKIEKKDVVDVNAEKVKTIPKAKDWLSFVEELKCT